MATQRIRLNYPELLGIREVTWRQIEPAVKQVNPELADIINEIAPSNDYTLIVARYPFGTNIRHNGIAYFPTEEGTLASIDDHRTPNKVKQLLSYNSSPLGFILNKSVEVYVETPEGRTIPFKLFPPGVTFGVWEIMEAPRVTLRQGWDWSISSGARTIFMPASINEMTAFNRIQREHKIKSYMPNNIFEHQKIFAEIAHHSETDWCTEILFFTDKWVKAQQDNPRWVRLKAHWMNQAWRQFMHWSNKMVTDFNWETFVSELYTRKIKPKPYLVNTIKHLVNIACGTIPGFKAVDDSELVAPSKLIQQAYMEHYGLKMYTPMLMQPDFLQPNKSLKTVYYSLQYPTLPEKPYEFQTFPSAMQMMRELKTLLEILLEIISNWPKINYQPNIIDFLEVIQFDFFHVETDKYGEIRQTFNMLEEDPTLNAYPAKYRRKFPEGAHFFRGCIRIKLVI
ncbi:MAG: hypothetical protein Tsb005_14420 [Gammaproteobacteria bacterium]